MYRRLKDTMAKTSTILRNSFFSRQTPLARGKAQIAFPINLSNNYAPEIQAIKIRLTNYLQSKKEVYLIFEKHLNEGLELKKTDSDAALRCFDKIIDSVAGQEIDNFALAEKRLLGLAYTYKAEIIRVGTVIEQNMALANLEKALAISPGLEEAENLKNGILADYRLITRRNS